MLPILASLWGLGACTLSSIEEGTDDAPNRPRDSRTNERSSRDGGSEPSPVDAPHNDASDSALVADAWPERDPDLPPDQLGADLPDFGVAPDIAHAPLGGGVITLAGGPQAGASNGFRDRASFDNPVNLIVDDRGTIYVCDFNNRAIRSVTIDGVVGTLTQQTNFVRPFGITFGADGMLYVETDFNDRGQHDDSLTGTIWRIDRRDGIAHVVARNLGRPRGLAPLPDGRLVLADDLRHYVRVLDPKTGYVTELAGKKDTPGWLDAVGQSARFKGPHGVATSPDGTIYVAEVGNHLIRRISRDGIVTTFAGNGQAGLRDAKGERASFNAPKGLSIDNQGNLYVTDTVNRVVRKIDPQGEVTTLAGNGVQGFADSLDLLQAQFYGMEGIAASPEGRYLFVADGNNGEQEPFHRLRRIDLLPRIVADLGLDTSARDRGLAADLSDATGADGGGDATTDGNADGKIDAGLDGRSDGTSEDANDGSPDAFGDGTSERPLDDISPPADRAHDLAGERRDAPAPDQDRGASWDHRLNGERPLASDHPTSGDGGTVLVDGSPAPDSASAADRGSSSASDATTDQVVVVVDFGATPADQSSGDGGTSRDGPWLDLATDAFWNASEASSPLDSAGVTDSRASETRHEGPPLADLPRPTSDLGAVDGTVRDTTAERSRDLSSAQEGSPGDAAPLVDRAASPDRLDAGLAKESGS